MAIDNCKDGNIPLASTSIPQRSDEHGFSFMNNDSVYHNGIADDCHYNGLSPSLSVLSASSSPHWDIQEIPEYHSKEIVPAGGNFMTDSSQFNRSQNFQNDNLYIHQDDRQSLLCRSGSDLPCPEGYIGQPYQYSRPDHLTIPDNWLNAAFDLNSFEKLHGGRKFVTAGDNLGGGQEVVIPGGEAPSDNIGQPLLKMNFGMPLISPDQGVAVSSNHPGKFHETLMTFDERSNTGAKSDSNISRIKTSGNSNSEFLPSMDTYQNDMGSRSFLNPGFDRNGPVSGFQNNNEVMSNIAQDVGVWMQSTDDNKAMFDPRPGLSLKPSYALQRLDTGVQNQYIKVINEDNIGLGGGKEIGMEFADVGCNNGFERSIGLSSLPFVGSQNMPCDIGQSKARGQLVPPSSPGIITNKSTSELLPKSNMKPSGNFSSKVSASPPFVVATGSTTGLDPSSNLGQPQLVGSTQQSNMSVGPVFTSDVELQIGKGNRNAQVSGSPVRSSLKRVASQPLSSTIQSQHRKTLMTHPFVQATNPTWNRLIPSIPPLTHRTPSLTPQSSQSFIHRSLPTWTKSSVSTPNISHTIPPLTHIAPCQPPQASSAVTFPSHDRKISSFLPLSQAQSVLPQPQTVHWRVPNMPYAPKIAPVYIKYKDQTPEPFGHKCLLCKRDLSYAPEGPIFQPSVLPAVGILPCGHTFHDDCLKRITPDDQSKNPPCIPCALGE